MISDQADSCLEVITCSLKTLAYCIPLASCFGGNSDIPKSHHQHVMRSQTLAFPWIPNCEAKTLVQTSNLYMKIQHRFYPSVKKWYLFQHRLCFVIEKWCHCTSSLLLMWFSPNQLCLKGRKVVPLVKIEKEKILEASRTWASCPPLSLSIWVSWAWDPSW